MTIPNPRESTTSTGTEQSRAANRAEPMVLDISAEMWMDTIPSAPLAAAASYTSSTACGDGREVEQGGEGAQRLGHVGGVDVHALAVLLSAKDHVQRDDADPVDVSDGLGQVCRGVGHNDDAHVRRLSPERAPDSDGAQSASRSMSLVSVPEAQPNRTVISPSPDTR